ncbi:hypothetical protein [Tuberibacillus sp. Marseille-P3662]|uniref:hypothetical protein n=1 Tax=Tuberibacillus sp. Marseille-P3662 TaxID=1965358 RepID=UPI00111C334B|nr:hypothetical protein [Tuberibacillus sp. Marseille-P3662]
MGLKLNRVDARSDGRQDKHSNGSRNLKRNCGVNVMDQMKHLRQQYETALSRGNIQEALHIKFKIEDLEVRCYGSANQLRHSGPQTSGK